ncbi:hypothetical protein DFH11DRAFT_21353 [Phellopilus nigrolimitatus]|nr:hypothetical protein DFH11DRAFT_21353 [Phellopilus nigrolimitatus]
MGTWNFTLNDTSPVFQYKPYSDGFGLSNGWQAGYSISGFNTQPGESGQGSSFHSTSFPGSSISLSFFGTGVSLSGQTNCTYEIILDGSQRAINSPSLNTLFSDYELDNIMHNITLIVQPSADNQALNFTGAQVTSAVSGSQRNPFSTRIDNQNTSVISYEGNWKNVTIPNIPFIFHETQNSGASTSLNFSGRAVEVRGQSNFNWWTYTATLDGTVYYMNASSWWIVPDALLFYHDGLDESVSHSLKLTNVADDGMSFALNSITTYQFEDMSSVSSSLPSPTTSGLHRKSIAGLVSGVVIGVVASVVFLAAVLFWFRRQKKRISSETRAHPNTSLRPYSSRALEMSEGPERALSHEPTVLFRDGRPFSHRRMETSSSLRLFGEHKCQPLSESPGQAISDSPRPSERVHSGPTHLAPNFTEPTDTVIVERLVDAVAERLAMRFGATALDTQTRPPSYSHV